MSADELREYLAFAEDIAKQAGKLENRLKSKAKSITSKEDNSPLTVVDEQINQLVIDAVKEKYPNVGVLGEELSHQSGKTSGLLWVCDPIDGTLPYILGASMSTFCLALVDNGDPVVGVVYLFGQDDLFSSAKGLGVFLNGSSFKSQPATQSKIVPVEWYYAAPENIENHLRILYDAKYLTPTFYSTSYDAIQLALGRVKGVIYANDKPWDFAAAKVVMEELGFRVTDVEGNYQRYDQPIKGIIASDGRLHKELLHGQNY